jgi:hypothetical protein
MVRYWCYRCLCTVVSQLSLFIYYSDCYAGIHVQSLLFTLDTVQSWLHIRYVWFRSIGTFFLNVISDDLLYTGTTIGNIYLG